MMTPQLLLEAEQRANSWLVRAMKIMPSSAGVSARHRGATAGASSAD
jgi:hypothetical protein